MANQNGPPEHFNEINHICCIGARHASVMSMAVIAAAHPQVTVTIVDYDVDLVQRWEQLDIDFVEPGFAIVLGPFIEQQYNNKVFLSTCNTTNQTTKGR